MLNYIQNLVLPHYDREQPGNTYYFSPLSVCIFIVVNHSPPKDYLYAFLYHERQRKKGANNAASIVF